MNLLIIYIVFAVATTVFNLLLATAADSPRELTDTDSEGDFIMLLTVLTAVGAGVLWPAFWIFYFRAMMSGR